MIENLDTSITRLKLVEGEIATAATEVGRRPDSVTLVVVSKTFAVEEIAPILAAGHRVFGENRIQEAILKWPSLRAQFAGVELHLIGPLQSNKVAEAVALFDVIQTVDRPKIARALAAEMMKQKRCLQLFVQVNTGEEAQKAGITPKMTVDFVRYCRDELKLEIVGLMCIPPVEEMPAPHFAFLGKLAAMCGVAKLSMGMSADYATAVQLGATHVRVGSAIFGGRDRVAG
ncbi:MAG: YggS family pyridoxal phosphate-dependent enzyme [Hyphomicrobiaceae bacterium]|nr:YggS family pyridoxal phosphate-dependent enzyme [Hyphomicrobiaceae bacterium]